MPWILLFCTAYALDFVLKDDPALMTFRNLREPSSFIHRRLYDHISATCVGLHGACEYERTNHAMDAFLFLEVCSSPKSYFQIKSFCGTMHCTIL